MKQTYKKPIHLHLDHFFRTKYCVLAVLGLMGLAMVKTDTRILNAMREAYAQGFGIVGQFMREETTRVAVTYDFSTRIPTTSGK